VRAVPAPQIKRILVSRTALSQKQAPRAYAPLWRVLMAGMVQCTSWKLIEPLATLLYDLQIHFPIVQCVTIEMYYNLILFRLHQEVLQKDGLPVNHGTGVFFVWISMVTIHFAGIWV